MRLHRILAYMHHCGKGTHDTSQPRVLMFLIAQMHFKVVYPKPILDRVAHKYKADDRILITAAHSEFIAALAAKIVLAAQMASKAQTFHDRHIWQGV